MENLQSYYSAYTFYIKLLKIHTQRNKNKTKPIDENLSLTCLQLRMGANFCENGQKDLSRIVDGSYLKLTLQSHCTMQNFTKNYHLIS